MTRLSEIRQRLENESKLYGESLTVKDITYLLSLIDRYREALERIKTLKFGHTFPPEDCISCIALDALKEDGMNPDCKYCGLEDGANIEHTCDLLKMKVMIDNIYIEVRTSHAKLEIASEAIEKLALIIEDYSIEIGKESDRGVEIAQQALSQIREGKEER